MKSGFSIGTGTWTTPPLRISLVEVKVVNTKANEQRAEQQPGDLAKDSTQQELAVFAKYELAIVGANPPGLGQGIITTPYTQGQG